MNNKERRPGSEDSQENSRGDYKRQEDLGERQRVASPASNYRDSKWVRCYPGQTVDYLREVEEELVICRNEVKILRERASIWEQRWRDLKRTVSDVERDLRAQVAKREGEVRGLEEENTALNKEKSTLMARLGAIDRDRTIISSLIERSRYEITQGFKTFCDRIYRVAKSISAHDNPAPIQHRKERLEGKLRVARMAARISAEVFQGVPARIEIPDRDLLREGGELALRLAATDPPIEVWFAKPGEQCDQKRLDEGLLEAFRDSEELGSVGFTIFPGLRVGERSLVPAVVWIASNPVKPQGLNLASDSYELPRGSGKDLPNEAGDTEGRSEEPVRDTLEGYQRGAPSLTTETDLLQRAERIGDQPAAEAFGQPLLTVVRQDKTESPDLDFPLVADRDGPVPASAELLTPAGQHAGLAGEVEVEVAHKEGHLAGVPESSSSDPVPKA